ncbi:MAG: hypothetical protein LBB26_03745 [Puniceicoccales bacterium]|jgi:hypothetical protein|nr:hypothetical protein [Puniceicoccales bacterium]
MKSTAAPMTDILDSSWGLRTFPTQGLTPGFNLEPPFLWESLAFSQRASPLPAAKAILKILSMDKKLS